MLIIPIELKEQKENAMLGKNTAVIDCLIGTIRDEITYTYGTGYDKQVATECWEYSIEAKHSNLDELMTPEEIIASQDKLLSFVIMCEYKQMIDSIETVDDAHQMDDTLDYMILGIVENSALIPLELEQASALKAHLKEKIAELTKELYEERDE